MRLRFPADKIRLWEDPNYHPADPLSTLSKTNPILSDFLVNDFTIDHTYYVEGLEVGVAEIDATYQVYDQPGLRTEGVVEITDTVKVTVVDRVGSVDIQIDDLGENLEQSPGAIIWRNSDFSNQIPAPNDPQEPGLPLYVPDYQAGLQGFPDELDPNYQADFTRGKVTIDPPFLMDHDLRFTFAADDIEIWTRSAWNDFESVGQGWYKVSAGIEITPEATSFEFWIEGINNSTAFAADSVRVEVVPRDLPSLLPSATDEAFYTVVETNFAVDGNRDADLVLPV